MGTHTQGIYSRWVGGCCCCGTAECKRLVQFIRCSCRGGASRTTSEHHRQVRARTPTITHTHTHARTHAHTHTPQARTLPRCADARRPHCVRGLWQRGAAEPAQQAGACAYAASRCVCECNKQVRVRAQQAGACAQQAGACVCATSRCVCVCSWMAEQGVAKAAVFYLGRGRRAPSGHVQASCGWDWSCSWTRE